MTERNLRYHLNASNHAALFRAAITAGNAEPCSTIEHDKSRKITRFTGASARNNQLSITANLAEKLGYGEELNVNILTAAQLRMATYAMLERREIQQNGRILSLGHKRGNR